MRHDGVSIDINIGLGLKACSQLKPKRTWNIATATLGSNNNRKRMSLGIRLHPSVTCDSSTTRCFFMLAPSAWKCLIEGRPVG